MNEQQEKNAKKRKKQGQSKDSGGQTAQSASAPEKAAKKGKKSKKPQPDVTVPIPDLLPKQEEAPAEPERHFDSNDILHRKYKRPEKKVIPSLSSVSLLPTMELKETFDNRSDLLNERLSSRPAKLPKLDATSRMFSEKKDIPEKFRPVSAEKKQATGESADSRKKSPAVQQDAPKQKQKPSKKKSSEKAAKAASPKTTSKQSGKSEKKKKQKSSQKQENRVVFTVASEKTAATQQSRKPRKQQKQESKVRFHHPADSSSSKNPEELKSLMKPYYLSDVKK